jgi:hypothetical protein
LVSPVSKPYGVAPISSASIEAATLATRSNRLGLKMLGKVPLWAPALLVGALISIGLEELGASGQVVFFADVALVLIYCAVVDLYRR